LAPTWRSATTPAAAGARKPLVGAEAVARVVLDRGRLFAALARLGVVNGATGVVVVTGDRPRGVCGIIGSAGRVAEIGLVSDSVKLRRVRQWREDA
jgi:hypothetical protein